MLLGIFIIFCCSSENAFINAKMQSFDFQMSLAIT